MLIRTMDGTLTHNVLALGAVADLETETVNLTPNFNRNENLILTTKTAIEPNACYALVADF